jgi:hypothetical protein
VWADVILRAEQQHVLYLLLWSAASILAGTSLGVLVLARRRGSRVGGSGMLGHFASQTAAWGLAELITAGVEWHGLRLRDLSAAARLEHSLWFSAGLELGIAIAGATLAIAAWRMARRLGAVGAGIGIVVQSLALLWLDLQLLAIVSR